MTEGFQKCILCRTDPPINNSHVIPKFVFKWMIATGGSKYLRYAGAPNKRVQDGIKVPLLCVSCERQIGDTENDFSQKIFLPSVNNNVIPKRIGATQYRFICSLHFRTIAYLLKHTSDPDFYSSKQKRLILSTFMRMRHYLKGESYSVSPAKLYLLPLGLGEIGNLAGLPTNWHRFIRRQTEIDLFGSDSGKVLGSYVKFGPWVSVCLIENKGEPWTIGEIFPRSTKVLNRHGMLPNYLFDYLIERARNSQEAMGKISDRQNAIIDENFKKADFVDAGKQMLDALHADFEAFGPDAFRRKK
ncbi:hypothetical protein [Roseovarius sp.]|uniref:hypothetical protein n=1 Tax=Roseovarius sp. TaxID=1486281 RepID=UPI003B59D2DC